MLNIQEMLNRRYFETNDAGASTLYYLHVDARAYLLFGVELSINIDLKAWNNELIVIYYESLEYGKE